MYPKRISCKDSEQLGGVSEPFEHSMPADFLGGVYKHSYPASGEMVNLVVQLMLMSHLNEFITLLIIEKRSIIHVIEICPNTNGYGRLIKKN